MRRGSVLAGLIVALVVIAAVVWLLMRVPTRERVADDVRTLGRDAAEGVRESADAARDAAARSGRAIRDAVDDARPEGDRLPPPGTATAAPPRDPLPPVDPVPPAQPLPPVDPLRPVEPSLHAPGTAL